MMERHWSFIVTDPFYLVPLAIAFLLLGLYIALSKRDATYFPRFGNFIVAIGVWMSMRFVFREGIIKFKNALDASPTLPGSFGDKAFGLNPNYFNNISFSIGDAWLSIYGFILVIIGSIIGSFGDIILKRLLPSTFERAVDKDKHKSVKAKAKRIK